MLSAMNMFRTLRPVIVMALIGLALGACGVKSAPQHSADSPYPQHYPAAEKAAPVITGSDKPAKSVRHRSGRPSGIYQYPNPPSYVPPEK